MAIASTDFLEVNNQELLPSHFEKLIETSLKSNQQFGDLYYKLLVKNECFVTMQGFVVNCSIPIEVSHSNVVRLSYLTGIESVGDYRVHLYISNQGTQMWNSIVLSIDFTFEEYGNAYRLVLNSFKKDH
jgi:hypothetical protein